MALAHGETFELYLWPTVLYAGIGATFGAMPTIVLQSVPPERSGQSSAINLIARTVGSAIGIQLAATFVTASVGASGVPTGGGYTAAFALAAAGGVVALLFALVIPKHAAPAAAGSALALGSLQTSSADVPATVPPSA
jgi:hypothetical protein